MTTAMPCYIHLPEDRQQLARKVLSKEIGVPLEDSMANSVIEQVWNALVGHPLADADELE